MYCLAIEEGEHDEDGYKVLAKALSGSSFTGVDGEGDFAEQVQADRCDDGPLS